MPLNKQAMVLDTSTRSSVKDARRWVVASLGELGRSDLVETAEYGIAELVTNAILHGAPPVKLALRGTREHPRVEVYDGSRTPPSPAPEPDPDDLLSTIGRGLGIVATCSDAWGADILPDGKIVWFEPGTGFNEEPDRGGEVFDPATVERPEAAELMRDAFPVVLERLPVSVYEDYWRHYQQLRRELRLLAFSHEHDYPVATSISGLFDSFDTELRVAEGVDRLEAAAAAGDGTLDVTLKVPSTTSATAAQLMQLLELADEFCRAERLLSLATTPQQHEFQRWYLGEFVRQGHGEPARAWGGGEDLERRSHQSAS